MGNKRTIERGKRAFKNITDKQYRKKVKQNEVKYKKMIGKKKNYDRLRYLH